MIKTQPKFWIKRGLLSNILIPLSYIYFIIIKLNAFFFTTKKSTLPIICIGNITIGGAGKTPTVQAIAEICRKLNKKVAILSKGYGGKIAVPTLVNSKFHLSKDVGDEAKIHSLKFQTWISKNRFEATKLIESDKRVDFIIMDDGLQNKSLKQDLRFLVFDGPTGIGNGRLLPSGPLREPFKDGINDVNAIIIIGEDKNKLKEKIYNINPYIEILFAKLEPDPSIILSLVHKKIIAFAGIGIPDKFFKTLKDSGLDVIEEIYFPDHHFYNSVELKILIDKKIKSNAILVTTEKDFIKISEIENKFNENIVTLPVKLKFNNQKRVNYILEKFFK